MCSTISDYVRFGQCSKEILVVIYDEIVTIKQPTNKQRKKQMKNQLTSAM